MTYIPRKYRTNLATKATVFIDGKEFECMVVDISTSGIKIEIKPGVLLKNTTLLTQLVNKDDVINFYVPGLYLDGEGIVTRVENLFDNVYISLTYGDVFYGLKNIPYRRLVYRSRYHSIGHVEINEHCHEFISQNISAHGMLLAVYERLSVNENDSVEIDLKLPNIHAEARVIWTKKLYNHNLLGVEFTKLDQPIKGFATFVRT